MKNKYRVTSTLKNTARILDLQTKENNEAFFSRKLKPICGDYVSIEKTTQEFRITHIEKRKNVFSRANRHGKPQHIASNIDQLVIVVAVEPMPTKDIINRYLVSAEINNISPILIFNKSDLNPGKFDEQNALYNSLSYKTLVCSTRITQSLIELSSIFKNKTSVIVGQSGVGKSSISQYILNDTAVKTGSLSKKTGKGAHTTSVTQLYSLKTPDSYLIDSPGVWEYGLWNMDSSTISNGFKEFINYQGQCKFTDCTHIHEPHCAIKNAVDNNQILVQRYESYLRIVDSMKYWKNP